ncbi:hypothetical protein [Bradyrhizobium japonicum]|uniref:hypothetical protein n=1 Tax=Bradyrhizobium japonicum TaxID=375 RepID=UPI002012BE04|nr:hypothetical protein [Bradyrhizobium japonicum]
MHVSDAGTEIFTRKSLNWTKRFTGIAAAYASAGLGSAIVDGEIVVVVNERADFSALQADLAVGRQDRQRFEPKGGIRFGSSWRTARRRLSDAFSRSLV